VLVLFGILLGMRFDASPLSVLAGGALALAFGLALSWIWVLVALAIKDTQAVQGLGAVTVLPLAFASNVFVPIDTCPAGCSPWPRPTPSAISSTPSTAS
jgi:ABC-type multidrug transport system permease subunit